ncbi:hypothetical protein M5689_002251 [Euphorbia peplus]|nr:hypothetical protein M5689_002251 [Euphorbia peplus]
MRINDKIIIVIAIAIFVSMNMNIGEAWIWPFGKMGTQQSLDQTCYNDCFRSCKRMGAADESCKGKCNPMCSSRDSGTFSIASASQPPKSAPEIPK